MIEIIFVINKTDRLISNQHTTLSTASKCVTMLDRQSRSREGCSVEMTGT